MTSTRFSREERKRSQFRNVFLWELRHNRIFFAFYSFFILLSLPVSLLVSILSQQEYYTNPNNWNEALMTAEAVAELYSSSILDSFLSLTGALAIPITFVFMLCLCLNTFGYMNSRRSVDLYHAFPIRRKPLMLGGFAAILVTLLLPLAVAMGACQLVCTLYHMGAPLVPSVFWQGYALLALLVTASLAFMLFFLVMSGTLLNAMLNLVAVSLGYPVVMLIVTMTMSMFLPGYVATLPSMTYTLFCPFIGVYDIFNVNLFKELLMGAVYYKETAAASPYQYNIQPAFLVWWILFSLVFLLLSVFCYDKRKSESAENNHIYLFFRSVVSVLLCVGGSLGLAGIVGSIMNSNKWYLLGLALGLVITHVVYHVVTGRGFKGFLKTIPAFAVSGVLIASGIYILHTGGLGYAARVPNAENVAKVTFSLPSDGPADTTAKAYWSQHTNIELNSTDPNNPYDTTYLGMVTPFFTATEDIDRLCNLHTAILTKFPAPYYPYKHNKIRYTGYENVSICYTLNNGSELVRQYSVPIYAEDTQLLSALADVQTCDSYQLYTLKDSISAETISGISVNSYSKLQNYDAGNYRLTAQEKAQIWDTFTEELNSPSFQGELTRLTSEEALLREQPDYQDFSYSSEDYSIHLNALKWEQLSPAVKELVQTYCADNNITETVTGISNYSSYNVPKCCTKTRELIYQLTEKNGTYIYFDENGNEVDQYGNVINDGGAHEDVEDVLVIGASDVEVGNAENIGEAIE